MTCLTGSGLSRATSVSSRVCHSASRAKLRPHVRTSADCRSGLRMPSFTRSWVYSSAWTSACVKATASSGWWAKPSSRHSSSPPRAGRRPARRPRPGSATGCRRGGSARRCRAPPTGRRPQALSPQDCGGNRSAAVFSSASWNDGISTLSRSSCSLVKWISSSGVSATMVAVRSEWLRIAVSPTMSPGPSCATSLPCGAHRHLPVQDDVGLVGSGRLRDRRPPLGQRHAGAGRTDEGDLLGCEHREEGVCHGQPFGLGPPAAILPNRPGAIKQNEAVPRRARSPDQGGIASRTCAQSRGC